MECMIFMTLDIYVWFILPLLIFTARIIDVSMQTIRIISVSKGLKNVAPLVGFFEVLIWIFAIGQIMQNLTNIVLYVAYAGGFAVGTFIGIKLENKLSLGVVGIRVITRKDASELVEHLRSEHVGVTIVNAQGPKGLVHIVYSIIDRHDIRKIVECIHKFNPHAFYVIEDVRYVAEGIFPPKEPWYNKMHINALRRVR